MASEHRRNYFLGISPGEWVGIVVLGVGMVSGYTTLISQANGTEKRSVKNEQKMDQLRNDVTNQIQQSEARTRQEIQLSEQRTREDIKELRQLIIKDQ